MGIVIMQGVPKIFGALRGRLCDSIAFLYFTLVTVDAEVVFVWIVGCTYCH